MCISCRPHVDVHKGVGGLAHVDACGQWEGGQKSDFFVDVINGWPHIISMGRDPKSRAGKANIQTTPVFSRPYAAYIKAYVEFRIEVAREACRPVLEAGPYLLKWIVKAPVRAAQDFFGGLFSLNLVIIFYI